jgi:hypothetical protein
MLKKFKFYESVERVLYTKITAHLDNILLNEKIFGLKL